MPAFEGIQVMRSSSSSSPLAETYRNEEFRRAWEEDLAARIAEDAIHLRRYRRLSQAQLATAMNTSQPKIAGIEAGDHNLTLSTLGRLARALKGRVRVMLYPQELGVPTWPAWWHFIGGPTAAKNSTLQFVGWAERHDETASRSHVMGLWSGKIESTKTNKTVVSVDASPGYSLRDTEVLQQLVSGQP